MKKSIVFSLLFLSLNGLYGMKAEEEVKRYDFDDYLIRVKALPEDLKNRVGIIDVIDDPSTVSMSLEHKIPIVGEYGAEHVGISMCFSPKGDKIASSGKTGGITIADFSSGMVQENEVYKKICLPWVSWDDNRTVVSFLPHKKEGEEMMLQDPRTITMDGKGKAKGKFVLGSYFACSQKSSDGFYLELTGNINWSDKEKDRSVWELKTNDRTQGIPLWRRDDFGIHCWSPDGSMLAFWNKGKVTIINMLSPLLALSQRECKTWDQILLLGKLQEMLRKKDPFVIIGEKDRKVLDEIGNIRSWFLIKKAKEKPLWLLTPRRYMQEITFSKEELLHRLAGSKRKRRELLGATLPALVAGTLAWLICYNL